MDILLNKRVLIITGSKDLMRSLNISLQMNEFNTILAGNAVRAMSLAMTERPDLILLDAGLPIGDAYRLIKRLQVIPYTRSIPIVIAKDISTPIKLEWEHISSVRAYIQVPLDSDELLEVVHAVFQFNVDKKYELIAPQDLAA